MISLGYVHWQRYDLKVMIIFFISVFANVVFRYGVDKELCGNFKDIKG